MALKQLERDREEVKKRGGKEGGGEGGRKETCKQRCYLEHGRRSSGEDHFYRCV